MPPLTTLNGDELVQVITKAAGGDYSPDPQWAFSAAFGGSGSTGANPSAVASDTVVNGNSSHWMRADAAPSVQKGSNTQFGLVKGDGTTFNVVNGVGSAVGAGAFVIPIMTFAAAAAAALAATNFVIFRDSGDNNLKFVSETGNWGLLGTRI